MNTTDEQKQLLLDRLNLGVSYQVLLLFVEQAFVFNKETSITALSELFEQFLESLSEDEKKQFREKMLLMIDKKAYEIQKKMGNELPPDELASVKEELKQIASSES